MANFIRRSSLRISVAVPFWLLCIVFVMLYGNLCRIVLTGQISDQTVSASALQTTPPSIPHTAVIVPATTTPGQVPTAPPATPASIPPAPTCSGHAQYSAPVALDLSTTAPGLTQQIDQPDAYAVYGYTAAQVDAQVQRCSPSTNISDSGAEFSAATGYRLNWNYTSIYNLDGSCSAANIRVGLHVNMALPAWQSTPYAVPELSAKWQQFRANLLTHEQGHVALDQQYAANLLASLQAVTNVDCGNISAQLSGITTATVQALNQANDRYDLQTNHGATQGAILP